MQSVRGAPAWLARRVLLSEYFVLYLSLGYFVALVPFIPELATTGNVASILSNMAPLLVVAIGQTYVLIAGGIDLSQTAVMGLVSVVTAALISSGADEALFGATPLWGGVLSADGGPLAGAGGLGMLVAVLLGVLVGAGVGLLNGAAVTRLAMPAFMVTLVTLTFFTAVAIWLTRGERIGGLPLSYLDLGDGAPFHLGPINITYAMLVALAVAVLAHLVLAATVFGRRLYAIGTNRRAAEISGVPMTSTVVTAYVLAGAFAALGGILYSARLGVGQPNLGAEGTVLLDIVGATVIGGTSLYGGRGKVLWTVFGVLFYVLLANTLNLLNLSFYTVTIVKGCVILAAVILDTLRRRTGPAGPATTGDSVATTAGVAR